MPKRRPIALTIVSWFFIVSAAFTILSVPFWVSNPESRRLFQAMGASPLLVLLVNCLNAVVYITAGIAMLKGRRWGRQVYLIATPAILLLTVVIYGFKFLIVYAISFVLFGVFAAILTRHSVSGYFSQCLEGDDAGTMAAPESSNEDSDAGKRIAGSILLVIGAGFLVCWFTMLGPLSGNPLALIFVSAVFGILACACIIPAVILWGRERWAGVLGTLLVSVGGIQVVMALSLMQIGSMPEVSSQLSQVDPDILDKMIRGSMILGIVSVLVGGLLFLLQRENSRGATSPVV